MIRAILFDFNGVVVDDEPVHFRLFQKVLSEKGVSLSKEDYYSKYLGMDDHDCFQAVYRDQGQGISEEGIEELTGLKAALYQEEMKNHPPYLPGVEEMIQALSVTHYLAIVSGALRSEIEGLLKGADLWKPFSVVVAAGEVEKGKPDPGGFIKAVELLNRDFVASSERLLPEECLVFEDSPWGIEAASKAEMPCIALTSSYPESKLPGALFCIKDFKGLVPEQFLNQVEEVLKGEG